MNKENEWVGKLIDSAGRSGTIKIDSSDDKQGKWQVELADRAGHISLSGTIEVNKSEQGLTAKALIEDKKYGELVWETSLKPADAKQYATEALIGEYWTNTKDANAPLQSGVLILWKFAE